MVIQVILLVAVAGVTALLTRSTAGARHQAVRRLLLVGFVCLAALSILFPSWLSIAAQAVGVGRGADLLLYALIIAFLGSLATTYQKISVLNRRITVLARKVTLAEAALATRERETRTMARERETRITAPEDDGTAADGAAR